MNIMNFQIKEIHIVIISILFLIFVNYYFYENNKIEGFAQGRIRRKRYPNYLRNYRYVDWYDFNYWLYYINPFYPPHQVDLPFEGKDGGISWYEPWSGGIYNY